MKVILIGNYPLDKQESMERFALMMQSGLLQANIQAEIWRPAAITAFNTKNTFGGIGKWLGYVDKWMLFPLVIKWRILSRGLNKTGIHFHVCDHSNSFYLNQLPNNKKSITCHDVIAIRAAFGHADTHISTSRLGLYLQKWILGNLSKANKLAAVSQFTLNQLNELVPDTANSKAGWAIIHNAFNAHFYHMPDTEAEQILLKAGLKENDKFILHVGSDLPRKNRKLLINMLDELGNSYGGCVCFAGHAIDNDLSAYAQSLNLSSRLISIVGPDHETLVALYSKCDAFVFPSFSEGFGWPITEAQACGTAVITSNIAPMPEVSGGIALYADPHDPKSFAEAFLKLKDAALYTQQVEKGYENAKNFDLEKMINKYIGLYNL